MSAIAIFACGLAVGAVGTAVSFTPLEAIDTLSKTQNIFAAGVALVAAVIAYKAQIAKVASDETSRRQDRQSKIDAIRDEVVARNKLILLVATGVVRNIEVGGAEGSSVSVGAGPALLHPVAVTAAARISSLWEGVDIAPRELRGQTVDLLIAHEEMVNIIEEFAESLDSWSKSEHIKTVYSDVLEISQKQLKNIATIEGRSKLYR